MQNSFKKKSITRLERLGNLLDTSIPLGKSGYRIGIDPLLGLIPGIGDLLSALIGSYIVIEAARLGVSRWTLGRMLLNLGLDTLIGAVPILGDFFDFTFKANQLNLKLLQNAKLFDEQHPGQKLSSAFILTLIGLVIFITLIFAVVLFTTISFLKVIAFNR